MCIMMDVDCANILPASFFGMQHICIRKNKLRRGIKPDLHSHQTIPSSVA